MDSENTSSIKMDLETAQAEFKGLCKSWKLTVSDDLEEKKDVEKIIRCIQDGILVVRNPDDGYKAVVDHHLAMPLGEDGMSGQSVLEYKFFTAGKLARIDQIDEGKNVTKSIAIVAALSNTAPGLCMRLHPKDMSIGSVIGGLFLEF